LKNAETNIISSIKKNRTHPHIRNVKVMVALDHNIREIAVSQGRQVEDKLETILLDGRKVQQPTIKHNSCQHQAGNKNI
jgi:hypothetical protein